MTLWEGGPGGGGKVLVDGSLNKIPYFCLRIKVDGMCICLSVRQASPGSYSAGRTEKLWKLNDEGT